MHFDLREVIDTVQMLEVEHFDIRTVTLGLSLRDCSSRLPQTVRARIYDKIRRMAAHHVRVAEEVEALYGVRIANKRVAVTPMALVADGASRDELIGLAQILDQAAEHVGVDYIAGFSALVEKGMTEGDRRLIEAIPEALATTERVCASVNCGSTAAGINADAVLAMAHAVKETARRTADRNAIGCARLVAFCNAVQDNPFIAGAFHGPSEPEAAINVGISGPGVILRAVREVGPGADFGTLADAIKRMAFKITRAGELIGHRVAEHLSARTGVRIPFGVVDISLAPTPAEGDSIAEILRSMGLEDVGAPGTTAALALLNESVKKGGMMAARYVGGLSGAFIPVAEDEAMVQAAMKGHITLEKLEAMTSICSVGLDMIALPGDTSAETLAAIMLDEFAIGMVNNKTTSCRLIPVVGKTVGDVVDYGGLLGRAPIMPVSALSSTPFALRGGRIPAPIRSLTN
ncbi:MAG: PFL family protein [Bacteroidetes bacterium]|nr:MAG: PFL family protein [Bacteroidota bacterium]